jgi:hypothetical protein
VIKFSLKYEVLSVSSILACCRSGGIQSEVVCSYMCLFLCNNYLGLTKLVNRVMFLFL